MGNGRRLKGNIEAAWAYCGWTAWLAVWGYCLPAPAYAEPAPVGLEAQGVDPWAALHSRDLDVRDAFNRPVSRRLIEGQIKAASSGARDSVSFFSRLPKARSVLVSLERMLIASCGLAAPSPWSGLRIAVTSWLCRPSPKISVFWAFLSVASAAAASISLVVMQPRKIASPAPVLRC